MAFWVDAAEPPKAGQDGGPRARSEAQPLREFAAVVPGSPLLSLWQAGAGLAGIAWNLVGAGALALGAWAMLAAVGNPAQRYSLAVGLYAAFSWAQGIRVRERQTFDGILGNRTFLTAILGFGTMSFVTNGMAFWTAPSCCAASTPAAPKSASRWGSRRDRRLDRRHHRRRPLRPAEGEAAHRTHRRRLLSIVLSLRSTA